jgi:hypothetical protein
MGTEQHVITQEPIVLSDEVLRGVNRLKAAFKEAGIVTDLRLSPRALVLKEQRDMMEPELYPDRPIQVVTEREALKLLLQVYEVKASLAMRIRQDYSKLYGRSGKLRANPDY